ncbi:Cys/Met metabolism PLP-dependent enzyme-domain-containing protein [Ochromonadaceae sp. CCMP2298]|nr:Cys/Met metabolism PLP-dependent enzyme-domain-containing protein [Ochromonadaceae sp. CCMP2298]
MMQVLAVLTLLASAQALHIQTKVVHAGVEYDHIGHAVVPGINLATTYIMAEPGVKPGKDDPNSYGDGFYYSRQANPTRGAFERALASAEDAKHCNSFSSGLAATQAAIQTLKAGDHVIALDDLYGGTSSYFRNVAQPGSNIEFTFMNLDCPAAIEAAIKPNTKMIWLESPTNPLIKTTDIRKVTAVAKKHNLLTVVDATFMSPYLMASGARCRYGSALCDQVDRRPQRRAHGRCHVQQRRYQRQAAPIPEPVRRRAQPL